MTTVHKSRMHQYQEHLARYQLTHPGPVQMIDVARWAIENELCSPEPSSYERWLAREFSKAAREEVFEDPQGRIVRRNHPFPEKKLVQGDWVTGLAWLPIEKLTREQMKMSLQIRRNGIVADCVQLDKDRESYNDNFNTGEALQTCLDFQPDVDERKNPSTYDSHGIETMTDRDEDDKN